MRPIFFRCARVKPHSGQASVSSSSDTALVFFCAAVSKRKPASWKPVGSVTPLSLEHLSQRFTCVIFPSTICVRKTVASFSHMSHFMTAERIRQSGLRNLLGKIQTTNCECRDLKCTGGGHRPSNYVRKRNLDFCFRHSSFARLPLSDTPLSVLRIDYRRARGIHQRSETGHE